MQPFPSPQEQPPAYQYQQPAYYPPYPGQPGYISSPQIAQRKITFKYGLLFGGILAISGLSIGILTSMTAAGQLFDPLNPMMHILIWALIQGVLAWIIYGVAGLMTARRTGQVSTGVFACLWASLWYLIVDIFFFVPLILLSDLQTGLTLNQILRSFSDTQYLLLLLESIALDSLLALTFGIGIGAIGAMIGKNLAPKKFY